MNLRPLRPLRAGDCHQTVVLARQLKVAVALGVLCSVLLCGGVSSAWAQADTAEHSPASVPVSTPMSKLKVSDDSEEVWDLAAKLAWRRCVQGMIWREGKCTGRPELMTFAQAQALVAAEGKATGQRWRLPQVPEFKRITDRSVSRTAGGALLDPQLFPQAPGGWHWTGSASVGGGSVNIYNYGNVMRGATSPQATQLNVSEGWAYSLETGEPQGQVNKRQALLVRLVRPNF